jgi:hypothetical protein
VEVHSSIGEVAGVAVGAAADEEEKEGVPSSSGEGLPSEEAGIGTGPEAEEEERESQGILDAAEEADSVLVSASVGSVAFSSAELMGISSTHTPTVAL